MQIRLNKHLVDIGACSRREADRLMEAGKISVDGKRAAVGTKINGNEHITINGVPVKTQTKKVYIAYHKPIGIICTSDAHATDNIIDAIGYPERLFHIGRLDVASSGLILLTNDGDIVNRILRAETKHEKEYVVTVDHPIKDAALEHMRRGILLDRETHKTLPAQVTRTNDHTFHITIIEGRNRQIRRMCEHEGYDVKKLCRIRIMHITLDGIPVGHWRHLTKQEEDLLQQSCKTG